MNQRLTTPLTRYLVLGPTVLLSWALGRVGYPPLPRLAVCVAAGAVLILLVARFQRRRVLAHQRGEVAS
jgi:hypothetical protein